jgi:hypothetical protein
MVWTVHHLNSTTKKKFTNYTKFEGEGAAVRTSAEQIDYLEELVTNTQSSLSKMVWMKTTGMAGKLLLKYLAKNRSIGW